MDIPNAIKIFRLKKGYKQSDLKIFKTPSTLSRFENGERDLKVKDLEKIIDQLDVGYIEFFVQANKNSFKNKVQRATKFPDDELNRDYLLNKYYKKEFQFSNKTKQLAYYYTIKIFFQKKWNLDRITSVELEHIFNNLISLEYLGFYEYLLFLNTIYFFDKHKTISIINKFFPLQSEDLMDPDTRRYAYFGLINAITKQTYDRDYKTALEIVELAEKVCTDNTHYYFRFSIQYFKNIINYRKTQDIKYLNKVYTYVDLIKDIGDFDMAEELEKEVKILMFSDDIVDTNEIDPTLIKEQ